MNKFTFSVYLFALVLGQISCNIKINKLNRYELNSNSNDQTKELQKFIDMHDTIYIPSGSYKISQIKISSNKTILTDGFDTKLKQLPSPIGTPIILVIGSNVKIDSIYVEGSIATDEGEWSHGLAVMSKDITTQNIEIKGLKARNIRGDGLYIGTSDTKSNVRDIIANNIFVENCLRNGVSIVTGENIYINHVNVKGAGLFGVDIEGDPPKSALRNINLKNIVGPSIGIIGGGELASNIVFENVVADGLLSGSIPAYHHEIKSGVVIRQAFNVRFDTLIIKNFDKFAIEFVSERSDKINENIIFRNLTIHDVSKNETIYNAYILTMGVKNLSFDGLIANISQGKSLFLGNDNPLDFNDQTVRINNAVTRGGYFARYTKIIGENLNIFDCEYCFQKLHKGSIIKNSQLSGHVINSLSTDTRFLDTTVRFTKAKFENCQMQTETNVKVLID